MREVMKKLGKELDETVDTLGVNHRLVARTRKRINKAKLHYSLDIRKPYTEVKEYAK